MRIAEGITPDLVESLRIGRQHATERPDHVRALLDRAVRLRNALRR